MRLISSLMFLGVFAVTSAAQAQQVDTVRIATLAPGALLWLHNIAEVKGFYKANGLDVKRLQVQDSPALVQAVASGSAEAGIALGDVVMRAIDQNAPVIIVGGYFVRTSLRMVAAKDVKSPKDLAGAKMTAGAVRGGTTNLLLYQIKMLGVDPNSIQRVSIPNSRDRVLALQAGQVRGALMTPPFDIMATQQGFQILDTYRGAYLQTPLILNTNWAGRNRAAAVNMVRASRSAAQWIYDPAHRKEAVDILAKHTNVAPDIAEASYAFLVVEQKAFSADFTVPEASLTNIVMIDRAVNPGDHPKEEPKLDVRKYYDPSYLGAK